MGFFTEFFARPRPVETERFRNALAMLESMSPADRADIGIRPADFSRIAREMAVRSAN
ncbi:hypothetical protein XW59_015835 [Aquamicrobium sp. LC103]|nr:hypothetical protein XW59_015835 [Aquamicrobium sp. LC103]